MSREGEVGVGNQTSLDLMLSSDSLGSEFPLLEMRLRGKMDGLVSLVTSAWGQQMGGNRCSCCVNV